MKGSLKKNRYLKFLGRLKKIQIAKLRSYGLLTREEAYEKRMSPIKTENNSDWSEGYAKTRLELWGFPELQTVDRNPRYKDQIKLHAKRKSLPHMLTPDFVVGTHKITANDPNDFYLDAHEITEGLWGNFNDNKNKFPDGNPIKAMYEEMNNTSYTSEKPYRLILNELNTDLRNSLYKSVIDKTSKYSAKRGGNTSKFGMISVMSNKNTSIAMVVYTKLILSIFDDMLIPFAKSELPSILPTLSSMKQDLVIPTGVGELKSLCMPFDGKWTFWLLIGYGPFKNKDLLIVNSTGLSALDNSCEVKKWLFSTLYKNSAI